MKGQAVYDCKAKCEELGGGCHNTKNRCIEKMCEVDKTQCKKMAKFLKCLMVCECLCSYICTCCCEMEEVSEPCLKELCGKCDKLLSCCKDLKGCLAEYECDGIANGKTGPFKGNRFKIRARLVRSYQN